MSLKKTVLRKEGRIKRIVGTSAKMLKLHFLLMIKTQLDSQLSPCTISNGRGLGDTRKAPGSPKARQPFEMCFRQITTCEREGGSFVDTVKHIGEGAKHAGRAVIQAVWR